MYSYSDQEELSNNILTDNPAVASDMASENIFAASNFFQITCTSFCFLVTFLEIKKNRQEKNIV